MKIAAMDLAQGDRTRTYFATGARGRIRTKVVTSEEDQNEQAGAWSTFNVSALTIVPLDNRYSPHALLGERAIILLLAVV